MLIITRRIKYMTKVDKKWFEKRILSCAEITFHLSIISHCELQFPLTKIRNLRGKYQIILMHALNTIFHKRLDRQLELVLIVKFK